MATTTTTMPLSTTSHPDDDNLTPRCHHHQHQHTTSTTPPRRRLRHPHKTMMIPPRRPDGDWAMHRQSSVIFLFSGDDKYTKDANAWTGGVGGDRALGMQPALISTGMRLRHEQNLPVMTGRDCDESDDIDMEPPPAIVLEAVRLSETEGIVFNDFTRLEGCLHGALCGYGHVGNDLFYASATTASPPPEGAAIMAFLLKEAAHLITASGDDLSAAELRLLREEYSLQSSSLRVVI
ncbi:hypothetical protein BDZ89DRAFT_1037911 [Hymenopellis radicata]|nr:hypothetical protein BDZ89DRAFT_1037911 [Hymenopellis radicata]